MSKLRVNNLFIFNLGPFTSYRLIFFKSTAVAANLIMNRHDSESSREATYKLERTIRLEIIHRQ